MNSVVSFTGDEVFSNPMIPTEEQEVTFGKPEDYAGYGWDNEYGKVQTR